MMDIILIFNATFKNTCVKITLYIVDLLINCDITTISVGVMVDMLTLSVVDREFESRPGQSKDYKIGICCFSSKNTALKSKSKDWLT